MLLDKGHNSIAEQRFHAALMGALNRVGGNLRRPRMPWPAGVGRHAPRSSLVILQGLEHASGAALLTRCLQSMLHEARPTNPMVFVLPLGQHGLRLPWPPASCRRAALTDALKALREPA
jgi:hypothetical protein